MSKASLDVVVAGHICLDLFPEFAGTRARAEEVFAPGRLVSIGPVGVALGGAVANTGLALHKLGAKTTLMGKVGSDLFGNMILELLRRHDDSLAERMLVAAEEHTSYTFVLSPPGIDRCFLHHTGTNDTFAASELSLETISTARILHFGYPPLMSQIYNDHEGFAEFLDSVHAAGVLTSLDMSMPDHDAPAGKVEWRNWLKCILPHVDVFLPSFDETLWMLDAGRYAELTERSKGRNLAALATTELLNDLASELLDFGAAVVVLKLGDQGMYLRTVDKPLQLSDRAKWREFPWSPWVQRELLSACFEVDTAGTTGAGDCTVAGLLSALLRGKSPEAAMVEATAVGACCVEQSDASSGIPSRSELEKRLAKGWKRRTLGIEIQKWRFNRELEVWHGPNDAPVVPIDR